MREECLTRQGMDNALSDVGLPWFCQVCETAPEALVCCRVALSRVGLVSCQKGRNAPIFDDGLRAAVLTRAQATLRRTVNDWGGGEYPAYQPERR